MTDPNGRARVQQLFDRLQGSDVGTEIDEHGNLLIIVGEYLYAVFVPDEDPGFCMVTFPSFWPFETAEERIRVLEACNACSQKLSGVKLFATEDNVWTTAELFVEDDEEIAPMLVPVMQSLDSSVEWFAKEMGASPPSMN